MRREQKEGVPDAFDIDAMMKHLFGYSIVQLPSDLQAAHRVLEARVI